MSSPLDEIETDPLRLSIRTLVEQIRDEQYTNDLIRPTGYALSWEQCEALVLRFLRKHPARPATPPADVPAFPSSEPRRTG